MFEAGFTCILSKSLMNTRTKAPRMKVFGALLIIFFTIALSVLMALDGKK